MGAAATALAAVILAGPVTHVRDGDTLEVQGAAVRLWGVSAPELHEQGGSASREFLARLVADWTVHCHLTGKRSHDRAVGVCYLGGEDIGAAMVTAGHARDCPRFSGGRYRQLEVAASRALPLPRYCR